MTRLNKSTRFNIQKIEPCIYNAPKHLEKDMTGILRLPDQLVAEANLRGVAEPLPEGACRERNSRLDRLLDSRASEKLTTVGPQVECVLKKLREAGADVEIVGSLARGDFKIHSDVDFLISDKGSLSEVDVFNITSDHLKDAPFDLVFADKLKPRNLALMRSDANRR
jgi:predicted nucleotidyltransferase